MGGVIDFCSESVCGREIPIPGSRNRDDRLFVCVILSGIPALFAQNEEKNLVPINEHRDADFTHPPESNPGVSWGAL